MDNGFEDFLRTYVIRDGSVMKEQYAKKTSFLFGTF